MAIASLALIATKTGIHANDLVYTSVAIPVVLFEVMVRVLLQQFKHRIAELVFAVVSDLFCRGSVRIGQRIEFNRSKDIELHIEAAA